MVAAVPLQTVAQPLLKLLNTKSPCRPFLVATLLDITQLRLYQTVIELKVWVTNLIARQQTGGRFVEGRVAPS